VSLEHTLFLDFFKLFVNMRLALSFAGKQKSYFLDLRIKSYGSLKFQGEVWAGRACAVANQQELTTCTKSGGQEEKNFKKNGNCPHRCRCRPAASGRPLVARRPRVVDTCACGDSSNFFEIFLFKKNEFLEVWVIGQGFVENGCTAPPFFEACPYTWKC
jgi:hypothetical protein